MTIELWPSSDPTQTISCAIALTAGRFSAVEVKGRGLPPLRPMQWYSTEIEIAALNTALQSLISGDLPAEVMQTTRMPSPRYVSATWVANVDDRIAAGLYIQSGLNLPAVLSNMIMQLLPGGMCDRALGLERPAHGTLAIIDQLKHIGIGRIENRQPQIDRQCRPKGYATNPQDQRQGYDD